MTKNGLKNSAEKPALGYIGVYSSAQANCVECNTPKSFTIWQILSTTRKVMEWDVTPIKRGKKKGEIRRWSVVGCRKYIAFGHRTIDTFYSVEKQRAYLKGLQTCDSAWICPMCSWVHMLRKLEGVVKMMRRASAEGCTFGMLTPTFPHKREDELDDSFTFLRKSLGLVFQGRNKGKFDALGLEGRVRAYEITLGKYNGWHPHAHVLLVFRPNADVDGIVSLAKKTYERQLVKAGKNVNQHTIDFVMMDSQDEAIEEFGSYVAKDLLGSVEDTDNSKSISVEVVGDKMKRGAGLSIFDIVALYRETENPRWVEKIHEFAHATFGHKKVQISDELKKKYLVVADDEEGEVKEDEVEHPLLVKLKGYQWRKVTNLEKESRYLEVVGERDAEQSNNWLVAMGVVEEGELVVVDGVLMPSDDFREVVTDDGEVKMVHVETGEVLDLSCVVGVVPAPATVVTTVSLSREAPRPVGRKSTAATLLSPNISDGQTGSQRMLSIIPDLGEGWFDDG